MAKCKQIFILVEQIDMHGWKMDTSSFITCVFLVWLNKIFCFFNKYGKSVHPVCFFLVHIATYTAISERNWQIYFFQGPCDLIWWGQCVKLQVKENFRQELPRQHGQQCRNNSLNDLKLKFLFFCPFIFLSLSRKY